MNETERSGSTPAVPEPISFGTSRRKKIILGLVVACSSMLLGINNGFVIVAVPQIEGTIDDISWFASICGFVAPIGSLAVGVIIDKFGRRSALLWGIIPSIFGWFSIYLSEEISMILIGRALCGLTYGALLYPQQVYTAECILVNHQRLLDSFKIWTGVANCVGGLFCLTMSRFLDYRELAGVVLVIAIVEFLLVFELLPESPIWLILQNRYGDAEWAQKKLGLHTSILYDGKVGITSTIISNEVEGFAAIKTDFSKIKRKDVYKPLIVTVILFILIMSSGPLAISVYMVNIIGNPPTTENATSVTSETLKTSDSLQFSIISGVFALLAQLILCLVLPYSSIRKISIPCLFIMATALAVLAYTTTTKEAHLYMLHVISVWVITFAYNFGIFNIPWALLGYIFPVDCKGFASIASAVFTLFSATSIKLFPYLEASFDGKLYYGYMTFSFIGAIFAYFFMPETVGKSQKEISDEFTKN